MKKYIVLRNGYKVSETEHDSYEDAEKELEDWNKIIKRWPDGSILRIETTEI